MRKLSLLFALLTCAVSVYPQGVRKDDMAQVNVQGFAKVIPGALITVCPLGSSGIPCTPANVPIFSNVALTTPLANPFHADANGNYGWFSVPGQFTYTITGSSVVGRSFTVTMPCAPGVGCSNLFGIFPAYTFFGNNTAVPVLPAAVTIPCVAVTSAICGTGTSTYLPVFTGPQTIGNSLWTDVGGITTYGGTNVKAQEFDAIGATQGLVQLFNAAGTFSVGLSVNNPAANYFVLFPDAEALNPSDFLAVDTIVGPTVQLKWAAAGGAGCTLPGNDAAVLFEHPVGTCASSLRFITDANGFVDINSGGNLEIDAVPDPPNNYFLLTGQVFFIYGNGAGGQAGTPGIQIYSQDTQFPIGTGAPANITNIAITSNLLTVTSTAGFPVAGNRHYVRLSGLTNAVFLEGEAVEVQSVDPATGTFTAIYTHADYPSAADTGSFNQVQGTQLPLFISGEVHLPGRSFQGNQFVATSTVVPPFTADLINPLFIANNGGFEPQVDRFYGLDVGGVQSGGTLESASILIEGTQTSFDQNTYSLKINNGVSTSFRREGAAFSIYSTGDVFASVSYAVKADETIGATVQTVGGGLFDVTSGGALTSDVSEVITFKICTVGGPGGHDTWDWSTSGSPLCQGGNLQEMTVNPVFVDRGVTLTWASFVGHTVGDEGTVTVSVFSCKMRAGSGSPETVVVGNVCDTYLRRDGGASTTFYVKESGTGNTGWIPK